MALDVTRLSEPSLMGLKASSPSTSEAGLEPCPMSPSAEEPTALSVRLGVEARGLGGVGNTATADASSSGEVAAAADVSSMVVVALDGMDEDESSRRRTRGNVLARTSFSTAEAAAKAARLEFARDEDGLPLLLVLPASGKRRGKGQCRGSDII